MCVTLGPSVAGDPSDKRTQIGTPIPRQTGTATAARPATPTPAPAAAGTTPPLPTPAPTTALPTAAIQTPAPQVGTGPVYVPPADPLLGQTLAGRYLIHKKLGEGGMGAVYLAMHTLLEKQVALKVLHGEFARKPDLVERFMQEAKAASRIRHENVIDISDFGVTPDGFVFFAMELLKGHDLHEEIARARLAGVPLAWERSRKIFLQICSALAAAHAQGIVHRDLKPENIYLIEFLGHADFVKLLDFGIAKLTEVSENDRKLTRTGMLFGTPEYMSPEQARGEAVDHRVDIYAMGCILYQLVVGRVPFEAENFMGILSQHLTENAPPVSPEALARVGAPGEVADIVARALAKHRDDRWPTIDDFANSIRALHGEDEVPISEVRVPRQKSAVVPAAAPAPTGPPGARQRTQWTGNLQVPIADAAPAAKKSIAPWLAAGAIVIAGGAIAAYVLTRPAKEPAASQPPVAVSPTPTTPTGTQPTTPDPTPTPPPETPVPAQVKLVLTTKPAKAQVFELGATEIRIGVTPLDIEIAGSRTARRYAIRLKGYQDKIVELVPDRTPIEWTTDLIKGASSSTKPAVVEVVRPGGSPVKSPGDVKTPGKTDKPPGTTTTTTPTDKPPEVPDPTVKGPDEPVKTPDKPDKPPDEPGDPDLIDLKRPEAGSATP
jgi:serine/threonine protein kinase